MLLFGEGELGPHVTQCRLGRSAYPRTKWHLYPSNRLATIHQRHRQTDRQTGRQRYDRIGRTVLHNVYALCGLLLVFHTLADYFLT